MNRLDNLVRDTLAARHYDGPDGRALLDAVHRRGARRRRARLGGLATAAAVIVAAAIAVPLTVGGSGGSPSEVTATEPAVPAGMQAVSSHGVEFFVPQAWKINDTRCATPIHDTAIVEYGLAVRLCAFPQPPGLTVARIGAVDTPHGKEIAALATTATTVGGQPARRGVGTDPVTHAPLAVLVLPGPGVVVSVQSPDPAASQRILDSVRLAGVDAYGCPARAVSLDPPAASDRPGAARALVPGRPTGASVCRYSADRLVRSAALTRAELDRLAAILNALPAGPGQPANGGGEDAAHCAQDAHRGFVVHVRYARGPALTVTIRIGGCDRVWASNGSRTTEIDEPLVSFLGTHFGYDGGIAYPLAG